MELRQRIKNDQLPSLVGEVVTISGFVHAIRNQGSIKFLLIRDISGITQCVVTKESPDAFNNVAELSLESVVTIKGIVKAEKQAPGGFEISVESIFIESKAQNLPIPVVVEKSGEEVDIAKRFDFRWLDLRREENQKIFKIWTALEKGFRQHLEEGKFVQLYAPSFTSSASESGSDVFEVKYFDRKAYLAQSPQFYKQMAMAAGLEKVFMAGPVFRAEPSYTTRHMTEFTGWDFEISYVDSHQDVMAELERFLVKGFEAVKALGIVQVEVPTTPFPQVTMAEAKKLLAEKGVTSEREHDLSPEEERELAMLVKEKYNHDFVFLTDWDISIRPFYHMRHADNPHLTKSFDLVYRGLEIVTGAQREHRYDVLIAQAKEKGIPVEDVDYYINFFRYGCPPHGGVGIGPGRIIMQMLGLSSVKEATFLPRDVKRLTP